MNVKISVLIICVEAVIYLLLYNLHDCTLNWKILEHNIILIFRLHFGAFGFLIAGQAHYLIWSKRISGDLFYLTYSSPISLGIYERWLTFWWLTF